MSEEVEWISVPKSLIYEKEELRLDGSYYSSEIIKARALIETLKANGVQIKFLGDEEVSRRIFWPSRFKRKYVSKKEGKPFLTPSEVFMFKIQARKFVVDYPSEVEIEPGWILITRSGSVGRTIISNKLLSSFVLSDDIIRFVPTPDFSMGYVYAYLNTWIGQALLTKTQYGATVKHIEPHHVASIPIPILDEGIIKKINDMILEVHKLREQAQLKLLEAEEMFYTELSLPKIDEEDAEYFGGEEGKLVKAFTINANELNLRLDASYHIPLVRAIKQVITTRGQVVRLKNVVKRIYVPNRFKRIYVRDEREGVPFLQGSHIPMIKFFDIKYLWNKMPNLENISLKSGWLLMTRSGTVGRVAIATNVLEGWAASEHIIRIILNPDVNPGYIWMFLTSIYGQVQIESKIYGGVVDEIAEKDTSLIEDVLLILPDRHIQDKIGNLVIEAYELKDKANSIEEEAIRLLEKELEELARIKERKKEKRG